jgi:hypothetical protein
MNTSNGYRSITYWDREKRDDAWSHFFSLAYLKAIRISLAFFALLLMCKGLSLVPNRVGKGAICGCLILAGIYFTGARKSEYILILDVLLKGRVEGMVVAFYADDEPKFTGLLYAFIFMFMMPYTLITIAFVLFFLTRE